MCGGMQRLGISALGVYVVGRRMCVRSYVHIDETEAKRACERRQTVSSRDAETQNQKLRRDITSKAEHSDGDVDKTSGGNGI